MKPHHYLLLALSAALAAVAVYQSAFIWLMIGFFIGIAIAAVHSYICEVAEANYLESLEDDKEVVEE